MIIVPTSRNRRRGWERGTKVNEGRGKEGGEKALYVNMYTVCIKRGRDAQGRECGWEGSTLIMYGALRIEGNGCISVATRNRRYNRITASAETRERRQGTAGRTTDDGQQANGHGGVQNGGCGLHARIAERVDTPRTICKRWSAWTSLSVASNSGACPCFIVDCGRR
ncbi:hypothetical protein K504DRAFT_249948 [Pleomassaria siparia CBS 279.74]|uniref:Uncharacterized protein n=1 Tax=Pleomassaria siparia CBS 279.74 TaxID=1314801 RepID=A0A6G1KC64_9PLEO|nr:hypothetical protein K504DRAFT_249948 [Pleomassaria siparia CBS 279.74]